MGAFSDDRLLQRSAPPLQEAQSKPGRFGAGFQAIVKSLARFTQPTKRVLHRLSPRLRSSLVLVILMLVLPTALIAVRSNQDIRQQAATNNCCNTPGYNSCGNDYEWKKGYEDCLAGRCGACGGGSNSEVCGNGHCGAGENAGNCSQDCKSGGTSTGGTGGGDQGGGSTGNPTGCFPGSPTAQSCRNRSPGQGCEGIRGVCFANGERDGRPLCGCDVEGDEPGEPGYQPPAEIEERCSFFGVTKCQGPNLYDCPMPGALFRLKEPNSPSCVDTGGSNQVRITCCINNQTQQNVFINDCNAQGFPGACPAVTGSCTSALGEIPSGESRQSECRSDGTRTVLTCNNGQLSSRSSREGCAEVVTEGVSCVLPPGLPNSTGSLDSGKFAEFCNQDSNTITLYRCQNGVLQTDQTNRDCARGSALDDSVVEVDDSQGINGCVFQPSDYQSQLGLSVGVQSVALGQSFATECNGDSRVQLVCSLNGQKSVQVTQAGCQQPPQDEPEQTPPLPGDSDFTLNLCLNAVCPSGATCRESDGACVCSNPSGCEYYVSD